MSRDETARTEEMDTLAIPPPLGDEEPPPVEPAPAEAEFPRGTVVDRYVVLDPLGTGGMGFVYSAYDPQLDRRVALKFLHKHLQFEAGAGDERPEDFTARLVREAQAMGRLSHPNVVAVYDVGVSGDGRVFLVMEVVDGGTLGDWLKAQKPGWREVLRVMCEAGDGLAAAHRAGVIHRDFKLDNVLMGSDGRPRVVDFGVARTDARDVRVTRSRSHEPSRALPGDLGSLSGMTSPRLTQTGALMGTPGYMAPEQYGGDVEIDERADVFAFSAALYRALYGERAFEGESVEQIAEATIQGCVRAAPKGSPVPTRLRRALLQGLSADRTARPQSMEELLEALRADPAKRRRRWLAVGALALAAVAAGVGVREAGLRKIRACRELGRQVESAWGTPQKATIRRAFDATGVAYAPDTWTRVEREVDRYANAWGSEIEGACVATRVRHERSEATLGLQRACLDDRLDELHALADALSAADAKTIEKAVQAAGALTPVALCANLDRLSVSDRLPGEASARREIRALQSEVAAAKAQVDAGKEARGLELLSNIAQRVEATGHGPLRVAFALAKGRAEAAGDPSAAAADYQQAALLADAHRLDPQRAEALIELGTQAHALAQFDDSHRWALLSSAAIERMGGDAALEVLRDVREGWTYGCEAKYDAAVPLFERALERARGAGLEAPELVASAHSGLADALAAQDRSADALDHMRVALQTVKDAYGAQHPAVAEQMINLATTELGLDRLNDALETASAAQTMLDAAAQRGDIPPASGRIGDAVRTVGVALLRLGRPREASDRLTRALDVYRAGGKESDEMALAASQLAEARRVLGERQPAIALLDEATEIQGRVPNIPPETVAGTLAVRGRIALDRGEPVQALELAARAFTVLGSKQLETAQAALAQAHEPGARDRLRRRRIDEQARELFEGILAQLP